jgi:signal transduction histidine kinase
VTCAAFAAEPNKLVVVLYPEAFDGSPGNALADRGIRSAFSSGWKEYIEIHNEYLDVSRFPDADSQRDVASYLSRKYQGRKVDLVMAGLSSALDFALAHHEDIFPNTPLIFFAIDEKEAKLRDLGPRVIGAPTRMDLEDSLNLALTLHPATEHVFVVVGRSKFDAFWAAEARKAFRTNEEKLRLTYLAGLPMGELLQRVKGLPLRSVVYYLHVFEDGDGGVHMPAEVLDRLSAVSNAPIYSHVDSYIGRGIVGGRAFSFEKEGERAAQLGLRILSGESPRQIGIQQPNENPFVFDGRQLRRWAITESILPPDSIVRNREPTLWDRYKWHIAGVVSLIFFQSLLIAALTIQKMRRGAAEKSLRQSQEDLRKLTGRLLVAQEVECRRIARELHDDFGQQLALLSVEMELLRQRPPAAAAQLGARLDTLSARVKQMSSSVHELSHQLHPMKLEQLGLTAAVDGLCNEVKNSHAVSIDFAHREIPETLSSEVATCLYRIAQESLRNVVKHSRAQSATVELRGLKDAIYLRIHDDGAGFDVGSVSNRGGLGLVSMRERLRAVQGEIAIHADPSSGTEIKVRIPLNGKSKEACELQSDSDNLQ